MGKLRQFWCEVAAWTLWPVVRGAGIATIVCAFLAILTALFLVARWALR